MTRRYYQVLDGKPFQTPLKFREICCDCSLVHDVTIRQLDDTTLEHVVKVNKKATAAERKKRK